MSKESRMRATVNQKLTEMGERERLKELLRAKLAECGWKDQMKAHCKEVIKDKGLEHVTLEDLVVEITPKGRGYFTSDFCRLSYHHSHRVLVEGWDVDLWCRTASRKSSSTE
ncbi:transcription and mRNA export factor ENY2 isoform X1 [Pungitius pungitius]|uniref:transcription and mRNA export factor ENY2 isoform X1 n=1 Tax=Pungitius pungitius TaxID=134920 RepID=UPI001886F340|nr:transcription and mRNA export factor ENY2 isoform X1 [Pungitius pungitius]